MQYDAMVIYPLDPSGDFTYQLKMAIEMVSFPIEHGGSFDGHVNIYQRVNPTKTGVES